MKHIRKINGGDGKKKKKRRNSKSLAKLRKNRGGQYMTRQWQETHQSSCRWLWLWLLVFLWFVSHFHIISCFMAVFHINCPKMPASPSHPFQAVIPAVETPRLPGTNPTQNTWQRCQDCYHSKDGKERPNWSRTVIVTAGSSLGIDRWLLLLVRQSTCSHCNCS